MIARALVHEPRLLILDEPTAGVDIELRRSMWTFLTEINERGTTIILTTHYLEEAENLCRNIAIIDHGMIVEHSSMKALLQKLDVETFLLDVQGDTSSRMSFDGFDTQWLDDHTLEVHLHQDQNLNELFALLSERDIVVKSMKNKANRLEELFVRLVESNLTN